MDNNNTGDMDLHCVNALCFSDDEGNDTDKLFDYTIHLSKDGYAYRMKDNSIITIYNDSIDSEYEMNSEGIYYKNRSLRLKCETLEPIHIFLKECFEYWETYNTLQTSKEKINILKYDYGWNCCYKCANRPLDTVILPIKLKSELMDDIEFFKSESCKNRYNELSLTHTRTYIFYGPPGTGKTSLVRSLATKYEMSIAIIDFDSDMDDKRLRHCIQRLPKKSILLLEDIDCLFSSRNVKDNNRSLVTFSGLLNALDGVVQNDDTMLIITTNHIEKLDDALKRRVDYFVKFDYANKEQIHTMFSVFFPSYEDKFSFFYDKVKHYKLTTNILQKFFTKYLFKDVTLHLDDLKTFTVTENMNNIYT
jgi:chaperone BCS1